MSVDASSANSAAGIDPSRARIAGPSSRGPHHRHQLRISARHREMESNFNPAAGASTSSARGLFQFIDPDLVGTVNGSGQPLGYATTPTPSPNSRPQLFGERSHDARGDPETARRSGRCSAMAGVLTRSNSSSSPAKIGAARPTANSTWRISWVSAARRN